MEWQEQIRKFYKPSEAKTLDGTITEAILSALGEAEGAVPKKWNTIYRNGNWGKWGCSSVARVRDSLVKEGIISHDKNSGKVLRLKD